MNDRLPTSPSPLKQNFFERKKKMVQHLRTHTYTLQQDDDDDNKTRDMQNTAQ